MVTTIDSVLAAAQIGETIDWEFKSARGGFPGSFWETYSAMANADGGVVVLGAVERDDGVHLDGLTAEQIGAYQKALWDGLNNRGQVSLNLLEPRHVEVLDVQGARVLAIRIPRATRTQRPVHLSGNPIGHTYRRRHEGDYVCSDAEVRRMLADADPEPADHRILPHFALNDLDTASLTQYRQRLRAAKGEHPWLALDDRELLERLVGWRRDRVADQEGPTLAGLLMFGKDTVIRDPTATPNYFVDYREKLDPNTRWSDRIYPDGTWEPNLFQFYQRVWPRLSTGLQVPFQLDGAMRRDETPAHEALREAFVNALIHADYAAPGGVVIERYPDRFVIENPGTLLVSREQYQRGGVSECRNKSLQKMFLMIGGGEQAGSGADKIRTGWRSQHWRAPRIDTQDQPDRVRLTLPMVSLIPDATVTRLREQFGARIETLSSAEMQALATADIEGLVSNARLQELLEDHPVEITRMLARMCERGLLVSDNRRRWTTYRLSAGGPAASPFDAGNSSHLPRNSSHLPGNSSHLQVATARAPSEVEALRTSALPVAESRKASPQVIRQAILELCRGRFLTTAELAELLKRTPDNLRNRHLTPLVVEGVLRLRYPEAPNRPDQAYTTIERQ